MADVEGYRPTSYGDGFADVYDEWYADVSPVAETAAFVGRRVSGLVVELGSGTGRLAGPLLASGRPVVGLDASAAMVLRSVDRYPSLPVVVADMVEPPLRSGCASGVLVAFNTLFNLPSASFQRRALGQAARLLSPGGKVIVEAFVPAGSDQSAEDRVEVVRLDADLVVLRVSRTDHAARVVSGHHVELRDGQPVRLRPWNLHYLDPHELDGVAAAAGLELAERFADWAEGPFDGDSPAHVSVYRVANPQK